MLFVFEIFYDLIIVSFIICILVNDALQMFLNCFKSIQFNLVSLNLLFNIVYTNISINYNKRLKLITILF